MKLDPGEVRFFSGQSHPRLAKDIASQLKLNVDATKFQRFNNDNLHIQLGASVRGRKVFILQSLIAPVSDHLMELFIMLDIARSAGASEVHAVIPYFSYARSDKKNEPRISITARLIADLLETAGATHVITMTLHSPQVHGYFRIPTDPLTARRLFKDYLEKKYRNLRITYQPNDTVVVAPDYGRAGSAARLAENLNLPTIAAEKKRISDTQVEVSDLIIRQVEGFKRAIVYDDEITTGGSVIALSKLLVEAGVKEILLMCTHGVFVSNALEKIFAIPQVTEIITTDTVPMQQEKTLPKVKVLSVAPVIAEAIYKNSTKQSIGDLFTYGSNSS
jgi:ribose-phosphate pyrophosphokinase